MKEWKKKKLGILFSVHIWRKYATLNFQCFLIGINDYDHPSLSLKESILDMLIIIIGIYIIFKQQLS